MAHKVLTLILGGGAGTRLYPLTENRSKPAVPIAGKYRLIDIPISNCLNSNIPRMFVLTQFNSASLNRHVKNTFHFDMFSKGFVDVLAAEQTRSNMQWFQGTADAVRQSMPRLQNYDYDYVLILSGDQLYQMDFQLLIKSHVYMNAELTVATIPVVAEDATGFGIMKVNDSGFIDSFIEKPDSKEVSNWKSKVPEEYAANDRHYLASMGIYLFNKDAIKRIFEEVPDANDFGKEMIPHAIRTGYRVSSYSYDGYWTDIGTIKSFFEANLELADPVPRFNLFDMEHNVYTRPRMLSPTKIFGTVCRRALLAEGSILNAEEIYRSVIGIRSRIGRGTKISECIIMGNDYYQDIDQLPDGVIPMGVGEDCHIERAIIDKNVKIGNGAVIKGGENLKDKETERYCFKEGIVVMKKGVVIQPGEKIGDV